MYFNQELWWLQRRYPEGWIFLTRHKIQALKMLCTLHNSCCIDWNVKKSGFLKIGYVMTRPYVAPCWCSFNIKIFSINPFSVLSKLVLAGQVLLGSQNVILWRGAIFVLCDDNGWLIWMSRGWLFLQGKEFCSQLQRFLHSDFATLSASRIWQTSHWFFLSSFTHRKQNWQSRKTALWSRPHYLQGILERCPAGVHMHLSR